MALKKNTESCAAETFFNAKLQNSIPEKFLGTKKDCNVKSSIFLQRFQQRREVIKEDLQKCPNNKPVLEALLTSSSAYRHTGVANLDILRPNFEA